YVIKAAPPASVCAGCSSLSGKDVSESPLPVYFPNTIDASGASPVDLPPGLSFTGVDFVITDARAVRIRGSVIKGLPNQSAGGVVVTLTPRRGTVATGSSQRSSTSPTGEFELRNLAPGSYDVVAIANAANGRLVAHASIDVASADVEDLRLVLQPL